MLDNLFTESGDHSRDRQERDMGRPPLGYIRTHINFDAKALERIDALVGVKGRSKFVRQAVDKMLEAVEFNRKLDADLKSRDQ